MKFLGSLDAEQERNIKWLVEGGGGNRHCVSRVVVGTLVDVRHAEVCT